MTEKNLHSAIYQLVTKIATSKIGQKKSTKNRQKHYFGAENLQKIYKKLTKI